MYTVCVWAPEQQQAAAVVAAAAAAVPQAAVKQLSCAFEYLQKTILVQANGLVNALPLVCRRAAQHLAQAVAAERDFNTAAFTKELVKFADTEVCTAAAAPAAAAAMECNTVANAGGIQAGRDSITAALAWQHIKLPIPRVPCPRQHRLLQL
jgi:hypothetical protein